MTPTSIQARPVADVRAPRRLPLLRLVPDTASPRPGQHHALANQCADCAMRWACIAGAVPATQPERLERLVQTWRKIGKGETLFRAADPFHALYAVRSGSFKTVVSHPNGADRVTGFQFAGETLGLDGIAGDRHTCDAVALEDSTVCAMPFQCMEDLCRDVRALQHRLHRLLAEEIVRDCSLMLQLTGLSAETRVATFLLDLSAHMRERGYSATRFMLRMTREEIGSYLGMKLETVSRALSRFQREGWLAVEGKCIELLNREALASL
ncbi:helix-turn-helix domain-containing protein [Ralstonia solanacearum]|uniref:helix-turn-helix domain-containing protein n=1 Tax=Ralstonia solanacearum TaxID=305 RepID=UPI0018D02D17|nr:helix-turn-helix domain-containing protein [Ralstonia solanacearum]